MNILYYCFIMVDNFQQLVIIYFEIYMQVAIIAGGVGTRLGLLTKTQPKSLIEVLGKPFIEYQFEFLKKSGIFSIVLCVGYLGKKIEEYCGDGRKFGLNLQYSYEREPLDTAGALKLAEPLLENIFFTLYGDSFVFIDFKGMLSYLQQNNKQAAMSVYKNNDKYDKSNTAVKNGLVKEYSKKQNTQMEYIDYGVNLFKKEVLRIIPPSKPCSMGTVFKKLIDSNELLAYEVDTRFYEIGSIKGLQDFTEYVKGCK